MSKSKKQTLDFLLEDRTKFATVSGIFTTKPSLIEWVDKNIPEIELITSKSYQVKPNPGNKGPIIVEHSIGNFGNAVGLRNPGMDKGHKDLVELRENHNLRSYLNVSLSANSIDDFIKLVLKFEDIADLLELNFSCPHTEKGFGSSIGSDTKIVKEYVKELRKTTKALLIPKLTPNVNDMGKIAITAMNAGADGISGINTADPMVYIELSSGKPILYNPNAHKGGKSGEWIKKLTLEKLKEVREAIGPNIPIMGMGGITTGQDVREIRDLNISNIGIGSVFARVPMSLRPKYITELKKDVENKTNNAYSFVSKERLAEYIPYKIRKITDKTNDLRIFELEGEIDFKPSQFAYIFAPEVSREGPFSIVKNNPLTFIVREREYDPNKNMGLLTHELFQLKEKDELIIRDIYGADIPNNDKKNAIIVAGGTGIAIIPGLVEKLYKQGKKVTVYYGITSSEEIIFEDEIKKHATYIPVTDNGVIGRVLNIMQQDLRSNLEDTCFYNVGPIPLMKKAMDIQKSVGTNLNDIYSSIETNNMCGFGICGECVCGDELTCESGTFFSMEYLKSKEIDIMELEK